MSEINIQDGTGRGFVTRVTNENRVSTYSIVDESDSHHAIEGDAFIVETGITTLTGSSESAVFYLKNTETKYLLIKNIYLILSDTVSGYDNSKATLVSNPKAGTIISNASSLTVNNRRFGCTRSFSITSYVGIEGDTFTDGTDVKNIFFWDKGRYNLLEEAIAISPNASMGLKFTPPSGNTCIDLNIVVVGVVDYLFDQPNTRNG